MGFVWFWIVAVMIAAYVVLDGFDLGVGILSPFLARDGRRPPHPVPLHRPGVGWQRSLAARRRRHALLRLPAALRLVVQRLLSAAHDRALAAHHAWRSASSCACTSINDVWRSFFDGLFFVASALLAIFFGAALANVIRGVPLGADSYFFLPLWTNWRVGPTPAFSTGTPSSAEWSRSSLWPRMARCGSSSKLRANWKPAPAAQHATALWIALLLITLISLPATIAVRPSALANYKAYPILFLIPALVVAYAHRHAQLHPEQRKPLAAFLSSCLYLVFMLVGAAAGLYPTLLPSSTRSSRNITIASALAGPHSLHVGLDLVVSRPRPRAGLLLHVLLALPW